MLDVVGEPKRRRGSSRWHKIDTHRDYVNNVAGSSFAWVVVVVKARERC